MESGHGGGSRGSLIVLEGLDRSGKTSQSSRLVSFLEARGVPVEAWHFPDRRTSIGGMISSYLANNAQLDDRAIHLLFSANRWEKRFANETSRHLFIYFSIFRLSYLSQNSFFFFPHLCILGIPKMLENLAIYLRSQGCQQLRPLRYLILRSIKNDR